MNFYYIFIFLASCGLLYFAGELMVCALMKIAKFLGWREFVVAFFIMAFATSMPNLFVGISSALHKVPQLSFGDVVGANVIDLTVALALATLISRGLPTESKLIQNSAIFTISIAILPLLLIFDGVLGRGDGIILILVLVFYCSWLFSKKERFTKVYDEKSTPTVREFKTFFKDFGKIILGILLLLLAAEGIVRSAVFFAQNLKISLALIGVLIVGLGTAIPEIYCSIVSAKKRENWLILGDLMGSVIVVSTLVLGIVALICPIEIIDSSPFIIARAFLIIAAISFILFVRTQQKITINEALFLLGLYIAFILVEILTK